MSDISKRPGAQTTSAPAGNEPFTLLTTARDNAEAAFIESFKKLQVNNIMRKCFSALPVRWTESTICWKGGPTE